MSLLERSGTSPSAPALRATTRGEWENGGGFCFNRNDFSWQVAEGMLCSAQAHSSQTLLFSQVKKCA